MRIFGNECLMRSGTGITAVVLVALAALIGGCGSGDSDEGSRTTSTNETGAGQTANGDGRVELGDLNAP